MKLIALLFASVAALSIPAVAAEPATGVLRHVVAFKFKSDATPAQIQKVVDEFKALSSKIPQIQALESGTNVSPEKRDKGFTHMFIATFKTEKDRDDYLVHAAHQQFVQLVGPVVDDVFVIDFWTGHP